MNRDYNNNNILFGDDEDGKVIIFVFNFPISSKRLLSLLEIYHVCFGKMLR